MSDERSIKGEIEGWSKEVRPFGSNNRGSRGLKVENDWHNLVGRVNELEEIDQKFPKGSYVEFKEKQNPRGFWDIEGEIKVISKEEAYPQPPAAQPVTHGLSVAEKDKDIKLAVAYNGVIEVLKNKEDADKIDFSETLMHHYRILKDTKIKLQEQGEW